MTERDPPLQAAVVRYQPTDRKRPRAEALRERQCTAPLVANIRKDAHAGFKLGVTQFDSTVGGLGGCPFAGQPKAAGNICTEELVLLCEEMGIDTGVDLDALIEVGRMAEEIVGHQLPGELIYAGSLNAFRRRAAA